MGVRFGAHSLTALSAIIKTQCINFRCGWNADLLFYKTMYFKAKMKLLLSKTLLEIDNLELFRLFVIGIPSYFVTNANNNQNLEINLSRYTLKRLPWTKGIPHLTTELSTYQNSLSAFVNNVHITNV